MSSSTDRIQQAEYIDMMWLDFHWVIWVGLRWHFSSEVFDSDTGDVIWQNRRTIGAVKKDKGRVLTSSQEKYALQRVQVSECLMFYSKKDDVCGSTC